MEEKRDLTPDGVKKAVKCSAGWIGIGSFLLGFAGLAVAWETELIDTPKAGLVALLLVPFALATVFWIGRANRIEDETLPAHRAGDFEWEKKVSIGQLVWAALVLGVVTALTIKTEAKFLMIGGALLLIAVPAIISFFRVRQAEVPAAQFRAAHLEAQEAAAREEEALLAKAREERLSKERAAYRSHLADLRPSKPRKAKRVKGDKPERARPIVLGGLLLAVAFAVIGLVKGKKDSDASEDA